MKKILCTLILLAESAAFADEIHYLDGTVAKGSVIQVTPTTVEYAESGGRPLVVAERSRLFKIVYDNGSTVMILKKDSEREAGGAPAQEYSVPRRTSGSAPVSDSAILLESGWNSYGGLIGTRFEFRVADNMSVNAGAGLGLWMWRLSAGIRLYAHYPYGLAFGIGFAYNTGSSDEFRDSGTVVAPDGSHTEETVWYRNRPVGTLNLTVIYTFSSRVYIETGLALSPTTEKFKYRTSSGGRLTKSSHDDYEALAPGGLMFGVGYVFF